MKKHHLEWFPIKSKLLFSSAIMLTQLISMDLAQALNYDRIPRNIFEIEPDTNESCEVAHIYNPPKDLIVARTDGRLLPELREAAQKKDPMFNLAKSAFNYLEQNDKLARAYADLSVTGEMSYEKFKSLHNAGFITEEKVQEKLKLMPGSERYNDDEQLRAAEKAILRSYKIVHILPYGNSPMRPAMDYIAVSGEDDQPHLPVNVPASPFTQHKMDVKVGKLTVRTRYMIAETIKDAPVAPIRAYKSLPVEVQPSLSENAKVLVYVHGMDSRLEEALDIFYALKRRGLETGTNWVMISMDLPTSGYATKLDHFQVSKLEELGSPRGFPPGFDARGRHNVPVLDFMENFVVEFINQLDSKLNVKNKIEAVIGGSLGGNLTFRLGRRTDLPWLKNTVTWSPAAIWGGLADGADIFKQLGVATAWNRSGGDAKNLSESADKRRDFFNEAFGGAINFGHINIVESQPRQWWRHNWPCFDSSIAAAKLERQEIYNKNFRLWHWRLGAEQLIFSQQGAPNLNEPRYLQNKKRMLLACGTKDDFNFTNICSTTKKTAEKMVNTPGRALILKNTGHSIHNERPNFFAAEIIDFLTNK